ncbi:hypothetical protein Tco_0555001, partial [Tanacetum coccineum]
MRTETLKPPSQAKEEDSVRNEDAKEHNDKVDDALKFLASGESSQQDK